MEADPFTVMADTFLRFVAIEGLRVLVWTPLYVGVALLHARLTRRSR